MSFVLSMITKWVGPGCVRVQLSLICTEALQEETMTLKRLWIRVKFSAKSTSPVFLFFCQWSTKPRKHLRGWRSWPRRNRMSPFNYLRSHAWLTIDSIRQDFLRSLLISPHSSRVLLFHSICLTTSLMSTVLLVRRIIQIKIGHDYLSRLACYSLFSLKQQISNF